MSTVFQVPRPQWGPPLAALGGLSLHDVLAGRASERVDIVAFGDSITEGAGTTDPADRWINQWQDLLRASFPTTGIGSGGGFGYIPGWYEVDLYAPFEPATTGDPSRNPGDGFGFRALGLFPNASNHSTWGEPETATWEVEGTGARVWYIMDSGFQSLSVAVDDPAPSEGWAEFSATNGQYCQVIGLPNVNTVGASGTFELQFYCWADDTTPAATRSLGGFANAVRLQLLTGGQIQAVVNDGGGHTYSAASTLTTLGITDSEGFWVRASFNIGADTVALEYSMDPPPPTTDPDSVSWTALSSGSLNTPTGVPTSVTTAVIGNLSGLSPNQPWDGRVFYGRGKMNGTTEWTFDPSLLPHGANKWYDPRPPGSTDSWRSFLVTVARDLPAAVFLDCEDTGTAESYPAFTDIDLGSSGAHEITLTNNTGVPSYVAGIQVFDGDEEKGIQVIDAAHAGYAAQNYASDAGITEIDEQVGLPNTGLVVIELGVNDRRLGTAPATFQAHMEEILDAVRVADPNVPVVLFISWKPNTSATHPWNSYVDATYAAAEGYDFVSILDFSIPGAWPQPGSADGDASGYYHDTVHPSEVGAVAIAQRFIDEFTPTDYRPFRRRPVRVNVRSVTLSPPPFEGATRLLEDGGVRLLESGGERLLED